MTEPPRLTVRDTRRILVRARMLTQDRPGDFGETVR